MTQPIPPGTRTITPYLTVENAIEAMAFYQRAFHAREIFVLLSPDGRSLLHGELQIGDSRLYLSEAMGDCYPSPRKLGASPVGLHLYVEDADAWFQRAVDAGCDVLMPMEEAFWGDRYGRVRDPYGHCWSFATHVRDVSEEDMKKGAEACMAAAT